LFLLVFWLLLFGAAAEEKWLERPNDKGVEDGGVFLGIQTLDISLWMPVVRRQRERTEVAAVLNMIDSCN